MTDSRARVRSLSLRNFRNFERLDLDIPSEGFALIGDNGQGKTNLLESMYYLSLLRSVRGARDVDVVRFGADSFFLEAALDVPQRTTMAIGFERAGGARRKRVRRDGAVVDRLSDALGTLPAVMFSPADVELVTGSPSARRQFLDIMLALTSRGYLGALQRYRGALERRNAVLRDASRGGDASSLDVWEGPLAVHGATLTRARADWVRGVADSFAARCDAIGEAAAARLRYVSSVDPNADDLADALARELAAKRHHDIRHGVTRAGPHRDDLVLTLGGHDLRAFGSAGQQRTAAIALRMLEAETLREARRASPVFLLDDPFAELDAARSARVLGLLGEIGLGQSVLAVPRETDIPPALTSLPAMRITAGRITA